MHFIPIFFRLIVLSLLLFATPSFANAQSLQVPSTWKNQRGSILTINSVDDKGSIRGTYINNAPHTECIGTPFDLHGQIKGRSILFYTDFVGCFTVTEWRGTFQASEIRTQFEAAYPHANGKLKIWKGTDVFARQ